MARPPKRAIARDGCRTSLKLYQPEAGSVLNCTNLSSKLTTPHKKSSLIIQQ
ncbi:MAG: hypothetical protein COC00_009805 [Rhizobiales bacterium]|nr:hypothetical protein [Hyphomicrobiales bacterium]